MFNKFGYFSFRNNKLNKKLIYHKLNVDKSSFNFDKKRKKITKVKNEIMNRYKVAEVDNKNNSYNKFKGYKIIEDEMKIMQKKRQRYQDIINLKTKFESFDENKSSINNNGLKSNHISFLLEERNRKTEKNKNPFRTIILFNHKNTTLNNFYNRNREKKYMESTNSKIIFNIVRRRIHNNKSHNSLKNNEKIFNLKLKKINQYPNFLSQQENGNTDILNTNEEISPINKQNQNYFDNLTNIKYSLNNNFNIHENYLRLFGKKVKCQNKIKLRNTLSLIKNDKINDKGKIFKSKSKRKHKDYLTDRTNSTDKLSDIVIKPIRLKNFDEWKKDI
jgi:hypothetical protein